MLVLGVYYHCCMKNDPQLNPSVVSLWIRPALMTMTITILIATVCHFTGHYGGSGRYYGTLFNLLAIAVSIGVLCSLLVSALVWSLRAKLKGENGFIVSAVGLLLSMLVGIYLLTPREEKASTESLCDGPGDATCKVAVQNHINSIDGMEVNYIQHISDGKFVVNVLVLDDTRAGDASRTVTTDCNCNVVGVN